MRGLYVLQPVPDHASCLRDVLFGELVLGSECMHQKTSKKYESIRSRLSVNSSILTSICQEINSKEWYATSTNCFNAHFLSTNPRKNHLYRFDRQVGQTFSYCTADAFLPIPPKSKSCSNCLDKRPIICDFSFSRALWNLRSSSLAPFISIAVCNMIGGVTFNNSSGF